ncbi:unnamed protein product [Rotaria sp. Silwood1]|nr:unnamed protein product [Rotaria sp. Silwood1]
MASSSSSTLSSSNREEDLTSENAESSASSREQVPLAINNQEQVMNKRILIKQEMEDVARSTNVTVQSNGNALLRQGHSTVNKVLETTTDESLPDSSPIDQAVLPITNRNISENNTTTASSTVEPHNAPTTRMLTIQFASKSFLLSVAYILESQTSTTTEENSQQQSQNQKHIMISYNQATASNVCQKIYDGLKARNYNVWFDKIHLHGSILDGMGKAVDNSSILILCLNNGYSNSEFCLMEAKYATERRIPIIPCIMEEGFRPIGGLGIINDFFTYNQLVHFIIFQFNVVEDGQQQESDNDHLIQHLLQCNESLAEDVRVQQENYANMRQHLLDRDERLAAFVRFQRRQEQNNVHLLQRQTNQHDQLTSIVGVQQEQQQDNAYLRQQFFNQSEQLAQITRRQQEQERNHDISKQLLQHVDQLTQLFVNQQQQHARNIEALHQLINRSYERNESLETIIDQHLTRQDRQESTEVYFLFTFIDRTVSNHDSPIIQLSVYPNYGFSPENIEVRCQIIEPSKYDNIYLSVKTDYIKPSGIILMVDNTINRCRTNKQEYLSVNICNSSLILIYINHTILNDTLEKIDYFYRVEIVSNLKTRIGNQQDEGKGKKC